MSDLGYEHGKDVIVNDERKPVLYDAKGRALVRPVGFRSGTSDKAPYGKGP